MVSLNNLVPIVGALISSLYQSRISREQIDKDSLVKFTYNFTLSLFVVMVSCLTIHVNILDHIIVLPSAAPEISMTILHYIVVFGLGMILLSGYIFGILIDHLDLKRKVAKVPFVLINFFNLCCTVHILFINHILTIRSQL